MAPTVSRGGFHQPLDLGLSEVLARPQVAIGAPPGSDCSVYGGWGDQSEVPLGHENPSGWDTTVRITSIF